jgi:hypothetical protein
MPQASGVVCPSGSGVNSVDSTRLVVLHNLAQLFGEVV